MTTYGGVDILLIPPNAGEFVDQHESSLTRDVERSENPQGNVVTASPPAPASDTIPLRWVCGTRAQLTALRAFLDARRGQLEACWIPSYQRDVEILAVVPFFGTVVVSSNASTMLPTVRAWRHWFVATPDGAYGTRYFSSATDLGDGTHVWGGSGGGPPSIGTMSGTKTSAQGAVISRLLYCRMASDTYRMERRGKRTLVSADFLEISAEAP